MTDAFTALAQRQEAEERAALRQMSDEDLTALFATIRREFADLDLPEGQEWFADLYRHDMEQAEAELQRRDLAAKIASGEVRPAITPEVVREVKERADLVGLFEAYGVLLSHNGATYRGLCPWHHDATPSLVIWPGPPGRYRCFGCGAYGDALTFTEQTQGVGFVQAVRRLAGQVGIALPEPTKVKVTADLDTLLAQAKEAEERSPDVLRPLFAALADLEPFDLAAWRNKVCTELGLKALDFNRYLRAIQQERKAGTKASPEPEILGGRYPTIAPALDFTDGLAMLTVPLDTTSDGVRVEYAPYLVTSTRQLIRADVDRPLEIGGQKVLLLDDPPTLGKEMRWRYSDIRTFLDGFTPDPVEVYLAVEATFGKLVDFYTPNTSDVLALWVMMTYCFPLFAAVPYVLLYGPKNSGKSKTLDIIRRLAFNAAATTNVSSAALFRIVENRRGAFLIDQGEKLRDAKDPVAEELRGLLNSGYKATGTPAIRCEGENLTPTEYNVFGPKLVASIRGVEEVLDTRMVKVPMRRTATAKGDLDVTEEAADWPYLRHLLYTFALCHFDGVRLAYKGGTIPAGIHNRDRELWAPLIALASFLENEGAGGLVKVVSDYAAASVGETATGLGEWQDAAILALDKLLNGLAAKRVTPKEVREAMASHLEESELEKITVQRVGYLLKDFFGKGHRTETGRVYQVSRDAVDDLIYRYNIEKPSQE